MAVARMLHAAEGTHPAIRDQANDFRSRLERLTAHYIREAVRERQARDAALAASGGARSIAEAIRQD